MADPEGIQREDTTVSEAPSNVSAKSKKTARTKSRRGNSPTSSRARSPESRPRSSQSSEFVTDGKRKKKQGPVPPGAHKVTFTVTIAKAIPTVTESNDSGPGGGDTARKKKRIVEAPRAQNFYHCEYFLLPDEDDPVKTDVVTFGMAAKIYTERQEPKVLKTWMDGDQAWVAWTHCHPVVVTEEVLMKLFNHTLELRIWDTRDKLSTRAKFDRPKAFRLPQAKAGEDADNVGGVKMLVMKQSRNYESIQPKRPYINRPLPSQAKPATDRKDSLMEDERSKIEKPVRKATKKNGTGATQDKELTREGSKMGATPAPPPPTIQPPTQDGHPLKSYGHLIGLAGKDPQEDPRGSASGGGRSSTARGRASGKPQKHDTLPALQPRGDMHAPPRTVDSDSTMGHGPTKGNAKNRQRNKKAEAEALAAAEHAKKHGVACVSIRMATLFAGMQTVTSRLDKPVPSLDDVFVTVSLNGSLMSEEQIQKLNPLIIKVHSATEMPSTPLSYADLRLRCMPAYVKYKFFNQAEHRSFGREQDEAIYWDDINVVLAGTMDRSELCEYLNGPALEIEVHDRDRVIEKQKLKPTLFGDDLEDQKISNVGTVTSKRTIHNPFSSRDQPWDPCGVARFDLSELLLGQTVVHLKAPIHSCPLPDVLGVRDGRVDGKLVGIAGATDGPTESPLPMGHYMQSNSTLKIRVELAVPLTTPGQIAANEDFPTTEKCPFSRIIFKFEYRNVQLLNRLQGMIMDTNAHALQLDNMPQHVIEAALSTYKLSQEQQQSRTLNIVTGFQLMDGLMHMFVLEGLRDGAITELWKSLPKEENSDMEVLFNSDLSFHDRLYGPLDVDLCRVKLHEPLHIIMQQPLLYVRDMVPQPCFNALAKLHQVQQMTKLRDIVRNDLFPKAEMVISMSREFGVPLTTEDFEDLQPEEERVSVSPVRFVEPQRTSRQWTPIDNVNPVWLDNLNQREASQPRNDYIKENKDAVHERSNYNQMVRAKTSPATVRAPVSVAHNYSTQRLNSTEQAKESLRNILATDPDYRFTYCPDYHHSMTVVPVNVDAVAKAAREASVDQWKTPAGWIFPGKKTMIESNVHPQKPHPARIDDVHQDWTENTLHANVLEPTLDRERLRWEQRREDFNIWRKPPPIFGQNEPATIHLAGAPLKAEKAATQQAEHEQWRTRLAVDDERMHFHRCAPDTEATDKGFKASNQLDRLRGVLKDVPQKLSLRGPLMALGDIPPLNVVLNPSVDTVSRAAGLPLLPAVENEGIEKGPGFAPGPYDEHSWVLERNKIPIRDYEHDNFHRIKGQDFNVYHKSRNSLHKRTVLPLTDKDYQAQLFRWPSHIPASQSFVIPSIEDMKSKQFTTTTVDKAVTGLSQTATKQKAVVETC